MSTDRPQGITRVLLPIPGHDHAWIAGLRAGQFDVFQQIYETYAPQLGRFACLSVQRDVAEDIIQDVMFDLWRRRTDIEFHDGLTPYLIGAVRKKIAMHIRHDHVVHRAEVNVSLDSPPGMGEEPVAPDIFAVTDELQRALRMFVNKLSPLQREILTLRWEHEMSYEQISDALGISLAAAQQHGSRAQRTIRPLLAKYLNR